MLQILDLSYNKLTPLTDERLFRSQIELKGLELSHNKLVTIDAGVLAPLHDLETLTLPGNPFTCDCKLRLTVM
jgi:Leucine-rich repeat (LRR) protein